MKSNCSGKHTRKQESNIDPHSTFSFKVYYTYY